MKDGTYILHFCKLLYCHKNFLYFLFYLHSLFRAVAGLRIAVDWQSWDKTSKKLDFKYKFTDFTILLSGGRSTPGSCGCWGTVIIREFWNIMYSLKYLVTISSKKYKSTITKLQLQLSVNKHVHSVKSLIDRLGLIDPYHFKKGKFCKNKAFLHYHDLMFSRRSAHFKELLIIFAKKFHHRSLTGS